MLLFPKKEGVLEVSEENCPSAPALEHSTLPGEHGEFSQVAETTNAALREVPAPTEGEAVDP